MDITVDNIPRPPEKLSLPMVAVPPCVYIEGNSGVGKTVTSLALASLLGNAFVCWEHVPYISSSADERYPAYPVRSCDAAEKDNSVWPAVDFRRQNTRTLLREMLGDFQVVDTSPLSVFAFELNRARLGEPHAIEKLAARYAAAFESGGLKEGNAWVFLTAPSSVICERLKRRKKGTHQLMLRSDTMEYMDRFRRFFAKRYLPEGSFLFLDTEQQTVTESASCIGAFLGDRSKFTQPTSGLKKLAKEIVANQQYVDWLSAL